MRMKLSSPELSTRQVCLPHPYFFFFYSTSLMPAISTGLSFRIPSFLISFAPHLSLQWSCSLRLFRKPDGFEAPVYIPWKDKIAYKFIVDGRWLTNDTEPTEVDHGFVNNVYTAPPRPPLPEPQPAIAPSSHHNESAVEPEHVEKVPGHADKPVENGSALEEPHKVPVPSTGPATEKSSTLPDEVKELETSIVDTTHAAVAQVAPDPREVERASDEVRLNPAYQKSVQVLIHYVGRPRCSQGTRSPFSDSIQPGAGALHACASAS